MLNSINSFVKGAVADPNDSKPIQNPSHLINQIMPSALEKKKKIARKKEDGIEREEK